MSRLGVLGGTFDPIHNGHLAMSREARRLLGLAGVLLVPAARPWQREEPVASIDDRVAMCELAAATEDSIEVSRIDARRDGPTYTVDTLAELAEAGVEDCVWIMGADALAGFMTWREPERIWELATIAAVVRPGSQLTNPGIPPDRLIMLEIAPIDISASEIRQRIADGASIHGLVPDDVADYIARKRLYRKPA